MSPFVSMASICESLQPSPSVAQRALLKSSVAEAISPEELEMFVAATLKDYVPSFCSQISVASARRSGKTEIIAPGLVLYAIHNAEILGVSAQRPACILIISNTIRHQARKTFAAVRAAILRDPVLSQKITRDLAGDESLLEFSTLGVTVRCVPNSPRAVRGYTAYMLLLEECDHWVDENGQGNFDAVMDAAEPCLATFDKARILKISSPAGPGSPLHRDFERRNEDADLLFWQLDSERMNPNGISQFRLKMARMRGAAYFAREYGAEFNGGGDRIFPQELLEAANYHEELMPPELLANPEFQKKCSFPRVVLGVDMGGVRDPCAFSVAVGQRLVNADESETPFAMVLYCEQWVPKNGQPVDTPAFLTHAFQVARSYSVRFVVSDRVDRTFVESYARRFGMRYERRTTLGGGADVRERYYTFREMLQQKSLGLPNHPDLLKQLLRLKDFLSRGVTTAGNQRDDVAVSAIQAAVETVSGPPLFRPWVEVITV